MEFIKDFEIEILNGWLFLALFLFSNIILTNKYPKHFKKRVFSMPKFANTIEKFLSMLSFITFVSSMAICVFLPLEVKSPFFLLGLSITIIGYFCYVTAMVNFATTSPDTPVTKGMYKYTRNPMQVMSMIYWLGVGLMVNIGLVLILCLLQGIFSYPTMLAQERFCIEKYGEPYHEYMSRTPRYLFFF